MIITLDGADFVGKTTLTKEIAQIYGGAIAPKATNLGKIPSNLEERLRWYKDSTSQTIIRAVLESDILRRNNYSKNMIIDRGRITVIGDCIAKTMLKEKCSYKKARSLARKIEYELDYHPYEDVRIYLEVSEKDLPALEKRKFCREDKLFSDFERKYYPLLIRALNEEAQRLSNLKIYAIQPIESIMRKIENLIWKM